MASIQLKAQAPAAPLVLAVVRFLKAYEPFKQLEPDLLYGMASRLRLAYFAKGSVLIEPSSGPPKDCFIVKQGVVEGRRAALDSSGESGAVLHMTPGEIFPVGALTAQRAVSTTYTASTDVFCWLLSEKSFNDLLTQSPVFLDFSKRRLGALLDLSMQQQQARYASMATPLQMMTVPLSTVMRSPPLTVVPTANLREVFELMIKERVGSVLISDASDKNAVLGIFTKDDLLSRICLPQVALTTSISSVMTSPVSTAQETDSIAQVVVLMASKRIRHVPVVNNLGHLVGIVTERDLFALQRQSLRQISGAIENASSIKSLAATAQDVRAWSRNLVAQGVKPAWVTKLISQLNDQLTTRILQLVARQKQFPLDSVCWIALGSEGREEQTIATDQDNGLILSHEAQQPAALLFARAVNEALDECGFPLCKGNIMASNPQWCKTLAQWKEQFASWADHSEPSALLNASIFFDFRGLAGDLSLAVDLRESVQEHRSKTRFIRLMTENALRNSPPLAWTGGVLEQWLGSSEAAIDLKVQGSGVFVDAARALALKAGVSETGTAARLLAVANTGLLPQAEVLGWVDAFEFIQGVRLSLQHGGSQATEAQTNPNLLDPTTLSELDKRILKETFRQLRKLQQRLQLDSV